MEAYSVIKNIRYLFTDIDDTLTTDGRLNAQVYLAIEQLSKQGIKVIPVTGGCAGWADHIARVWPVAAVIAENGALALWRDGRSLVTDSWHPAALRSDYQKQLLEMSTEVIKRWPELQLAQDQPYRLADVAIDYNQQVSGISDRVVKEVVRFFLQGGANARASSIHINCWFGEYSKAAMARKLMREHFGLSDSEILEQCAFIGDAPNDEPMFAWLRHTFAVANIAKFLPDMVAKPKTVLQHRCGAGFVELAELILFSHGNALNCDSVLR